jgi:hypothetical protein
MDVVGAHQLQAEIAGNRLKARVDDFLFLDSLELHLEEEIPGAEDVAVLRRRVQRLVLLFGADAAGDLTLEAAAQPDQSRGVLREEGLVDPRLVVEALRVPGGDELDEVVEALVGFSEQDQVVGGFSGRAAPGPAVARRDVHLASDDGLDPAFPRLVVKDDRREHVAVLGDSERRHLQFHRTVEQFLDPARAVQQRVLRMKMQMNEISHGDRAKRLLPFYSHSIVDGGFELMS